MSQPKKGVIKEPLPWRKFFDNKYLSSHDLTTDLTVTIKEMRYEEVTGERGRKDECLIAVFTDPETLPMIMNVTNSKTISKLYGTKIPLEWVGQKITLFVDNSVRSKAGEIVGGLRIRPVKPAQQLQSLPDGRFKKMLGAIEKGEYSLDKAKESFVLTPEQIQQLEAVAA